jgi:hypothetical protein
LIRWYIYQKLFSKNYYFSRVYNIPNENDNSAAAGQKCTAYQPTLLYQLPTLKKNIIHLQFVCQVHYSCDDNICERYVVVTLYKKKEGLEAENCIESA